MKVKSKKLNIDSKITDLKGVGEKLGQKLTSIGVSTVADLIDYYPRDYRDFSNVVKLDQLKPGLVSFKADIEVDSAGYRKGGLHITKAIASDDSGKVSLTWFNQPYRANSIKSETEYFISGELDFKYGTYQIVNPSVELVSDLPKHSAKIVSIYPERAGISSRQFRDLILQVKGCFLEVEEILPESLLKDQELPGKSESLRRLHLPKNMEEVEEAKARLGFEEIFELQLASLMNKKEMKGFASKRLEFDLKKTKDLIAKFGFDLTDGQRKAAWKILKDIDNTSPMNRLLQGDVGSGKTVIAAMAANQALINESQAVLMAPTEVLAFQHYKTLTKLLGSDSVKLLTSDTNVKEKKELLKGAENGDPNLYVGTHALIQEGIKFKRLDLAVIDEQHRFGVDQRKQLLGHDKVPHLLSMTATPIPRSLALTVYGELDVSVIDELPPGRKPVQTEVKPFTSTQEVDRVIEETIRKGEQVYVICPLIESSESISSKNAEEEYRRLKSAIKTKVGLLHGRLSADKKQTILDDFKDNKIKLLVSTTVVEVGVDVPNASLIVIEGAERFGLAQLHQLRGRVGRSDLQARCILVTSAGSQPSSRLRAMESTSSGFKLAEIDLKLRGPGSIYGTRQHGALDLRMASLADTKSISHIREVAKDFLDREGEISHYPALASRVMKLRSITQLN